MLYNLSRTEESNDDEEADWDNEILPIRKPLGMRRAGGIGMQGLSVSAKIIETQSGSRGAKDSKSNKGKEKDKWKEQIEFFVKNKRSEKEQRNILDQMKSVVRLGNQHIKVKADEDKFDDVVG